MDHLTASPHSWKHLQTSGYRWTWDISGHLSKRLLSSEGYWLGVQETAMKRVEHYRKWLIHVGQKPALIHRSRQCRGDLLLWACGSSEHTAAWGMRVPCVLCPVLPIPDINLEGDLRAQANGRAKWDVWEVNISDCGAAHTDDPMAQLFQDVQQYVRPGDSIKGRDSSNWCQC